MQPGAPMTRTVATLALVYSAATLAANIAALIAAFSHREENTHPWTYQQLSPTAARRPRTPAKPDEITQY